ncbi:MAG: hypothetical protein ACE5JG_02565 [Planctomycetota bacterium]
MGRPVMLALALASGLASTPARASRIRPLNLEQMTRRADRIFSGRCVGVQVERDAVLGRDVTLVTFAVRRRVKGDLGGLVRIKLLGVQVMGRDAPGGVAGLPRFSRGEEVVVFLYGDSRRGLTSPVGFGQGKFVLLEDKQGRRLAVNSSGNRHLLAGLSPEAERALGERAAMWRGRGAIPAGVLLDMAESLAGIRQAGRSRP